VPLILNIICHTTGMGFSAVARVTEDRWIACAVNDKINFGLAPGGELEIKTTICNEIRQSGQLVVIDHVFEDKLFKDHHTPAQYGFQSYISVPIILKNGEFFGTLCSIDPNPAKVNTPEIIGMFTLFAELIAFHLNSAEKLEAAEIDLATEKQAAVLREQFVAILGHDLRNPVTALHGTTQLLLQSKLDDENRKLVEIMQRSTSRIKNLTENLLDLTRGRFAEGIGITRVNVLLTPWLMQVIDEIRLVFPNTKIYTDFNLEQTVYCDASRIAQLLSNLLNNAVTHGRFASEVLVKAGIVENDFILSVRNEGDVIPQVVQEHLFRPFFRGKVEARQQGLGLGLYIATEIAKAHGGTLSVNSDTDYTTFTLSIPASA